MRTRTLGFIAAGLLASALILATIGTTRAYGPNWTGGMMGGYQPGAGAPATPLTSLAEAQAAFAAFLARSYGQDLTLAEVMEFERNYYAIAKDRDGGALELLADKQTGSVFVEYGPAMMWNTRYDHMSGAGGMMGGAGGMMGGAGMMGAGGMMGGAGGMMGGAGGMMGGAGGMMGDGCPAAGSQPATSGTGQQVTVSPERAREIAQQWLDTQQPGSAAGQPDAFPGYYTLHTERDGQITGMLSVNASTGQVWYHNWHGAFLGEADLDEHDAR